MVYEILGRYPEAIKNYKALLDLNPNHKEAMFSLGWALMDEKRYLEAAPILKQAVRLNPKNADTHYSLGMVYAELGRNDDALTQYRKTLQMDVNHTGAHEKIARLQKEADIKPLSQPTVRNEATRQNSDIILVP